MRSVSRTAYLLKLLCLSGAGFALWMALDLILVRLAPDRMHDFDWLDGVFGFAVFSFLLFDLRQHEWSVAIALSAFGTLFVCVFTMILALFVGIWFHLSIGGTL